MPLEVEYRMACLVWKAAVGWVGELAGRKKSNSHRDEGSGRISTLRYDGGQQFHTLLGLGVEEMHHVRGSSLL